DKQCLLPQTYPSVTAMNYSIIILIFAAVGAVPDCYLPFLSATSDCKSESDCRVGACVYSINRLQRVCCEPKAGSPQPECPTGKPSTMPLLCDPHDNDVCPDGYECRMSTTEFEKNAGEPNYLCCRD
uniref:Secreted protein n=1 Tax=Haemonchus contortus TaxID=6289 RepID=A0A7I4YYK6_HAECO